jgi:hypothetical protein
MVNIYDKKGRMFWLCAVGLSSAVSFATVSQFVFAVS